MINYTPGIQSHTIHDRLRHRPYSPPVKESLVLRTKMRRGLRVNFPGMVVLGTLLKCCWAHYEYESHALAGFQTCTVSSEVLAMDTACISQNCGCGTDFTHYGNSDHTADGRAI